MYDHTNSIDIGNCSQVSIYNNQFKAGTTSVNNSSNIIISNNSPLKGFIAVVYCNKSILIDLNYCANVYGIPTSGIIAGSCEHITIKNNNCTNNDLGGIGCEDSVDVKIIGKKRI